jgi:tetratricopeptide (TPR) repeat protein
VSRKSKKQGELAGLDRVLASLEEAPPGLHDVDPPSPALPSGLPPALIELYARCDGARMFIDSLELVAAAGVTLLESNRWQFAELEGDPIAIDAKGKIWRTDASIDDDVCDGTRLDRWLSGQLDGLGLLYDVDGEFADNVFDDDGELLPEVAEQRLRAQIKRDPSAPGPRWRLGLALLAQGVTDEARTELEQTVADDPTFAWAWLDLARISEKLGELTGAVDEARMAADVADGSRHPQAGYFWSQLARLAVRGGDELLRAQAATKTSLLAPELKRAQLDGASERLEAGDQTSAAGLLELLRAVWPRDLEVLDLARRIDAYVPPPPDAN